MSPETPVKRKRGRPPKAGSLSNKITTTININVNTPASFHNTPTAEINSNLMIKRGAPDIMTPLMKVLPTPRRKKVRRENSASSILLSGSPVNNKNISPYTYQSNGTANGTYMAAGGHMNFTRTDISAHLGVNGIMMAPGTSNVAYGYQGSPYQYMVEEGLVNGSAVMMSAPTPMSMTGNNVVYTPQINSKTMDNMSMITLDSGAYYSTPPSLSAKGAINLNYWASTPTTNSEIVQNGQNGTPEFSIGSLQHDMNAPMNLNKPSDLLPPALIQPKTKKAKRTSSNGDVTLNSLEKDPPYSTATNVLPTNRDIEECKSFNSKSVAASGSSDFMLKLMVDDLGKAVLSEDMFNLHPKPVSPRNGAVCDDRQNSNKKNPQQTRSDDTDVHDFRSLKRFHLDACIIAPTPTSTVNSDDSILPATPKTRDNYLLANGHGNINGMTPNASNLTFNLTPQFNSMVHSMMNGNGSPFQPTKTHSVQLFALNSEPFGSKNQLLKHNGQIEQHFLNQNGHNGSSQLENGFGQRETINVAELMGIGSINNSSNVGGMSVSHNFGLVPKSSTSTSGTSGLVPIEEFASGDSSADLSDARLALKRLVHIKRERD